MRVGGHDVVVAASYKPLMLVTRVRLLACALVESGATRSSELGSPNGYSHLVRRFYFHGFRTARRKDQAIANMNR